MSMGLAEGTLSLQLPQFTDRFSCPTQLSELSTQLKPLLPDLATLPAAKRGFSRAGGNLVMHIHEVGGGKRQIYSLFMRFRALLLPTWCIFARNPAG